MLSNENSLRAPSIQLREWAKRVRILMFIICIVVIGYFSGQTVASTAQGVVFWFWIIVNALAWTWETRQFFRRSTPLLVTSERAVQTRYQTRVWIFWVVVGANALLMLSVGNSSAQQAGPVTLMIIVYNVFTLAWLEYDAMRWYRQPRIERWFWSTTISWSVVASIFGLVVYISLRDTSSDHFLVLGVSVMVTAIAIISFIMQRLGVEDHVQASVIRDLSNNILGVPHATKQWNEIVELIGDRLRYKRVYILEPSMEAGKLKIVGQYGDGPHVLGKDVPIDLGITGRSFRTGEVLAWNNVAECEYYYHLLDQSVDDVSSEIAIPIQYLGVPYGILDIQDTQPGVFTRQDLRSLEVIARIVGAALSAQKSDSLVDDAYHLWEELS